MIKTITNYKLSIEWVKGLENVQNEKWFAPYAEGKASIAEIVAHLLNWDRYLINNTIPAVQKREGMNFPDFDSHNQIGYEYANSGITKTDLINEFITMRTKVVNAILMLDEETVAYSTTANGVSHCPRTHRPYSLLKIIEEFTEHDEHHRQQIVTALSK